MSEDMGGYSADQENKDNREIILCDEENISGIIKQEASSDCGITVNFNNILQEIQEELQVTAETQNDEVKVEIRDIDFSSNSQDALHMSSLESDVRSANGGSASGDIIQEESFTDYTFSANIALFTRDPANYPYQCLICKKRFRKKLNLKIHIGIHADEKPYKCKLCDKSFRQSSYLSAHKRTHSDRKPFKCGQCSKCFRKGSHLRTHILTHTGEKPYQCMQCNQGFRQLGHLTYHLESHARVLNIKHQKLSPSEKAFQCKQCGKGFHKNNALNRHMQTHSTEKPFECQECKKRFRRFSDLTYHSKIHSALKPHSCQYCEKGFIKKSNLSRHLLTAHSKEKPVIIKPGHLSC